MTAKATHWSDLEDFGILWGMKFLIFLHRYLGRFVLPLFLYPVVGYYLASNRTARQASLDYLTRLKRYAHGVNIEANAWFCFRHFLNFAHSTLDRVAAWTGLLDRSNVVWPNRPEIEASLREGKGLMMIAAHLGCLEVCRALASHQNDIKLNVLVHTKNAQRMNRLLEPLNLHRELELIEVTEVTPMTAIVLKEKIQRGEVVVVVGDRVPVAGQKNTVVVDFLGAPAAFAQGPFVLAHVLKCPVMTLFCLRQNGRYHIYCEPFADRIELPRGQREAELRRHVARYVSRLEQYCQVTPLQWFNFYPYWRLDAAADCA